MKKIIIVLCILAALITSCSYPDKNGNYSTTSYTSPLGINLYTAIIDSCEYIIYDRGIAHKGNCKFCKERRKEEYATFLEDIIIELY